MKESKTTKKGLASGMTKPKTQKTEVETENLQGKGNKKLPHLPHAPRLQPLKPKVSFYLLDRTQNSTQSGLGTVSARISYNKEVSVLFSTKVQGYKQYWNVEAQRFVGRDYTYHNSVLDEIEFDVQTVYKELLAQKIHVNAELIKKLYTRRDAQNITVLELIDLYMKKCEAMYLSKQIGIGRIKQLRGMSKHIRNFLTQSDQANLLVKNVRIRFNTDLYEYLLLIPLGKAYIRKVLYTVKSLFDFAMEKEYILVNPYKAPKIKVEEKNIIFLNLHELQKLKSFSSDIMRLQRARDLFIFQCYTGFAYADMQSFNIETDTQVLESGAIWIIKERQKTNTLTRVPLFPEAFEILQKYDFQLPKVLNHKYNKEIKEVAKLANISKHLTTHVARKTAGFLWLNSGLLSYKEVSPMLGHKSVSITERHYAKVLTNSIENKIIEAKIYTFVLEKELKKALATSKEMLELPSTIKPLNQ